MVIIFDFDGTIHDTMRIYKPAFEKGYKFLLENTDFEKRPMSDKDMSNFLGYTTTQMWEIFAPELDNGIKHKASVIIGSTMDELTKEGKARLFDTVPEVLEKLSKEHTLAFLSNCRTSYKDMHRKVFGLNRYFKHYYWAEKYPGLPKYEIFSQVIKKELGDQKYVMVGDRHHDIEVGTKNHIDTIGCLYGFAREHEIDDATYFAKKPLDILDIIEKIK